MMKTGKIKVDNKLVPVLKHHAMKTYRGMQIKQQTFLSLTLDGGHFHVMKMAVFWDVAPCSLVDIDRPFTGTYFLPSTHHLVCILYNKNIKFF
jgi:hypothetical protein